MSDPTETGHQVPDGSSTAPAPDDEQMFVVSWPPTKFDSLEEAEANIAYHSGRGHVQHGTSTVIWDNTTERSSLLVPPLGNASDMLDSFLEKNEPDA